MKITSFNIEGLKLIEFPVFGDSRGFFTERFRKDLFERESLPKEFVQDNFSRSKPMVLRGLHYQFQPAQGKLVTCMSGRILDVAVDIRAGSKTFGQHISVELSGDKPQWLWIPAGFAHGFCVMGNEPADVLYKVDAYWGKGGEGGLHFNDPDLAIDWPVSDPVLTEKDQALQSFASYREGPRF